jgi:hypothetical protein
MHARHPHQARGDHRFLGDPPQDRKMSAIPLFGKADRNFIGNEFFNALICKLLE